ncbi:MAG TPA: PQQ-binding-like beta-propeller repeat protein [Thermoplasmata archaeon]|nr:PQQ-binding-like beta-propeller repeat protein [Thermoplasmata archaeon]
MLAACPGADWPTYMGNVERQANAFSETAISARSAPGLRLLWNYSTGADVSASPALVRGVVYIGAHNGEFFALRAASGALVWKNFLGIDTLLNRTNGVASSATVAGGVVYVGGGNSSWYAVSAKNGTILWNVTTGNISQGYFNWASPLLANGDAYIGIASKGDMPLVYGGLLQVSLATHAKLRFFNTTAAGTLGASIWTSPALDPTTHTVFVTTGNPGPGPNGSVWGQAILGLGGRALKLVGHWTVPANQSVTDGDFGATPTVFNAPNGTPMVAAANKNGIVYAWDQAHLASGPVWERTVAYASGAKGLPNLGPSSWSPGALYVGSSLTSIGGVNYSGSVRAFDAANGTLRWVKAEPNGAVLGAPVYANGLLIVGAGDVLQVLNASSGATLFHYTTTTGGRFQGPAAVAHGEIVIGASDGRVYAFGVTTCRPGLAAPDPVPDLVAPVSARPE